MKTAAFYDLWNQETALRYQDYDSQNGVGFSDNGRPEPFVNFDYGLSEFQSSNCEEEKLSENEWEKFGEPLEKLFCWIVQNPQFHNNNGVQIRALIVAWFVKKELRPLSLTELSRAYGYKKQSVGREVESFKAAFPGVFNEHMKNTRSRNSSERTKKNLTGGA